VKSTILIKTAKTVYVTDRHAWHPWFAEHYDMEKEAWLIYLKKAGKALIEASVIRNT